MKTVTKKELVHRIAEQTGTTKVVAKDVIQSFLNAIIDELAEGNFYKPSAKVDPHHSQFDRRLILKDSDTHVSYSSASLNSSYAARRARRSSGGGTT